MLWYQYVAIAVAVIATAYFGHGIIKDESKKKKKRITGEQIIDNANLQNADLETLKDLLNSSGMDINYVNKIILDLEPEKQKEKLIDLYKNRRGGKTRRRNTRRSISKYPTFAYLKSVL